MDNCYNTNTPTFYYNSNPTYDFMEVGARFFRINRYTGQAWEWSWGGWILVPEKQETQEETAE
jgi:hypothetical protein